MNFSRSLLAVGLVGSTAIVAWSCGSDNPAPAQPEDAGTYAGDGGGGADGYATTDAGTPSDSGAEDTGLDAGTACSAASPCSGGLTCCNDHCVDTKKSPTNCGACGVGCAVGTQFCNGTTCKDALFQNVCQSPNATLIQDGITEDDTAGATIGTALGACTPAVTVRTVLQSVVEGDPTLGIMADGGAPLSGPGDMLVTAGGDFGQHMVKYMETNSSAPIMWSQVGTTITLSRRSTGAVLKTLDEASATPSHDYAVIELAVDAPSGTLTLIAQGLLGPGTRAASFYLSKVMIATPATYDQAFYIYEWTDANANLMPEAGEFALVSSGK
jgi:hypothetical protein